jgi:hypothetical protein
MAKPRKIEPRARWIATRERMGALPCLHLSEPRAKAPFPYDAPEKTLSGRYGDIWEYAPGVYWAVVTSARVARRLGLSPVNADDEVLLKNIPAPELARVAKALGVSSRRPTQLEWAENFSCGPREEGGSGGGK